MSEILKRASSGRTRMDRSESDGITLEELQQVGSELGFDPAHIELAARQLGTGPASRSSFFSPRLVLDRTVDGEARDDDWQGMVGVIQRYHKGAGAVNKRGSNYDWAGSEEGAGLALTVSVRDGRTRIRLESSRWMGPIMASMFVPALAFAFSAALVRNGHGLFAVPLCLGMAALYLVILRLLRLNHAQLVAGLVERLVDEVRSEHPSQNLASSSFAMAEDQTAHHSIKA